MTETESAQASDSAKIVIHDAEERASKVLQIASGRAVDLIQVASDKAEEVVEAARISALRGISQARDSFKENIGGGFDVIANDISYIKRDIGEIKGKLESDYVSKDEFAPVRNIVYGLVGVLGVATLGAIMKIVLKV